MLTSISGSILSVQSPRLFIPPPAPPGGGGGSVDWAAMYTAALAAARGAGATLYVDPANTTNDSGSVNVLMVGTGANGAAASPTRGFCGGTSVDGGAQTLTKYIWEYPIGGTQTQIPNGIY